MKYVREVLTDNELALRLSDNNSNVLMNNENNAELDVTGDLCQHRVIMNITE
jgi:hypothetical protein